MYKSIFLSAIIVAAAGQALAMKNYEIQSTTYGTDYTYWYDEGHIVKFKLGHNMSVKQTYGYNTIDEYLASQNCT